MTGDPGGSVDRALDGSRLSLPELHGKVVVVNIWGSWYRPYDAEFAHLEGLGRMFGGRVEVIGLAWQDGKSGPQVEAALDIADVNRPNPDLARALASVDAVAREPYGFGVTAAMNGCWIHGPNSVATYAPPRRFNKPRVRMNDVLPTASNITVIGDAAGGGGPATRAAAS